jgi:hypothetical protein
VGVIDRDAYVKLLPQLSAALPKQVGRRVFLTDMDFEWVTQAQVDDMIATAEGEEGAAGEGMRRREGPGMEGPGMEGPPEGVGGQGRGGRPGMEETEEGPDRLVLRFRCESEVIQRGESYIRDTVLERLRNVSWPESGEQVFNTVKMVGSPVELYRSSLTGQETSRTSRRRTTRRGRTRAPSRRGPDEEQVAQGIEEKPLRFLAFEGFAVLKAGEGEQAGETPEESAGPETAGGPEMAQPRQ